MSRAGASAVVSVDTGRLGAGCPGLPLHDEAGRPRPAPPCGEGGAGLLTRPGRLSRCGGFGVSQRPEDGIARKPQVDAYGLVVGDLLFEMPHDRSKARCVSRWRRHGLHCRPRRCLSPSAPFSASGAAQLDQAAPASTALLRRGVDESSLPPLEPAAPHDTTRMCATARWTASQPASIPCGRFPAVTEHQLACRWPQSIGNSRHWHWHERMEIAHGRPGGRDFTCSCDGASRDRCAQLSSAVQVPLTDGDRCRHAPKDPDAPLPQ